MQRRSTSTAAARAAATGARTFLLAAPLHAPAGLHRLDAISLAPRGSTIQRFPFKFENTRTRRMFVIELAGTRITARQIAGDGTNVHSGHAEFVVRQGHFELHSIQSDPEEGSGVGSILVYWMAKVALAMGYKTIDIPMSAGTAVGFYELMGFTPANELGALQLELALVQNDDQHALYAESYALNRARIAYETDVVNRRAGRRWDALNDQQKVPLVAAQRQAFALLSKARRIEITSQQLHGKAVQSSGGMVAQTPTIIERSWAVASRNWQLFTLSDESIPAWMSRHDKTTLTSFPAVKE